MIHYHHRQTATPMLVAVALVTAGTLAAFLMVPETRLWMSIVLMVLAVVAFISHSLYTTVTSDVVRVAFGPGLIRRLFRLSTIRTAYVVRNRWYYGWGIRLIPTGWMFNASGLDAVELELTSGHRFRIGTDDPAGLIAAIASAREKTPRN